MMMKMLGKNLTKNPKNPQNLKIPKSKNMGMLGPGMGPI